MQNKPNFQKTEMVVNLVKTMTNNNEQRTMNYSKQTQSNPILPATPFGGNLRESALICGLILFKSLL
jgi:hypothetical protein